MSAQLATANYLTAVRRTQSGIAHPDAGGMRTTIAAGAARPCTRASLSLRTIAQLIFCVAVALRLRAHTHSTQEERRYRKPPKCKRRGSRRPLRVHRTFNRPRRARTRQHRSGAPLDGAAKSPATHARRRLLQSLASP